MIVLSISDSPFKFATKLLRISGTSFYEISSYAKFIKPCLKVCHESGISSTSIFPLTYSFHLNFVIKFIFCTLFPKQKQYSLWVRSLIIQSRIMASIRSISIRYLMGERRKRRSILQETLGKCYKGTKYKVSSNVALALERYYLISPAETGISRALLWNDHRVTRFFVWW